MANKALSKRQKLTFRVEPSQKPLKQRAAGPQRKTVPAAPYLQKHALKKTKTSGNSDDD